MTTTCPTIGKATVQRVFAELEDVSGVLQKPTAQGFIAPAGQASLRQTPAMTDSEELAETLDIIDQFQDAVGPGEASVPMYLRLPGDGSRMQGHALLTAALGKTQEPSTVTATLAAPLAAAATSLTLTGLTRSASFTASLTGGELPLRGVVTINDEAIRYTGLTVAAGTVTLTGCRRGHATTTPAAHEEGDTVTLVSRVYSQSLCRPTVSLWLQMDHTVLFGSGGVVTQTSIPMSSSGGQRLEFSLQFRRMGWAGRSFLEGTPDAVGVLYPVTSDGTSAADAYTEGAFVKNTSRGDDNNGAGYRVTAVNADNGTITLSPPPAAWNEGDQIDPWLPTAQPIGTVVESREARVMVGNAVGKLTEGSLALGTPTAFAAEIGDEFPGENADIKRALTINTGMYMRAADAVELGKGYKGYEVPVAVLLGTKPGGSLALAMKRVKLNTPEISARQDFVTLTRTGAIMGTKGEDSLVIVQE